MDRITIAEVSYQIGTYRGTETVYTWDDLDDEGIIRRARRQLRQKAGTLPPGVMTFRVSSRRVE